MNYFLVIGLIFNVCYSAVNFSGDARFRPRNDIKQNGDKSSTSDFYYLYRARLNIVADIEDGWFFSSKIGTNSVAGMTKMGIPESIGSAENRPTLSFMELYFGQKNDKYGFWAGALPLKGNSALDLHYYSHKLVDIPFVLFNNSSIVGLSGYINNMFGDDDFNMNWFLSVDENVTNVKISSDELVADSTFSDHYTFGNDIGFGIGSFLINTRILIGMGNENVKPVTISEEITLPEFLGFKSKVSYTTSKNGKSGDEYFYEADHQRLLVTKAISKGKIKFFYDMATKNDDKVSFLWFSYTHNCYKGEMGEVTISPTVRLQIGKDAGMDSYDKDYSRSKFELTTQIKFK